ncbi:MAG: hypothetical protein QXQ50_10115 [Candidatus Bathyarchaeia archaeon]
MTKATTLITFFFLLMATVQLGAGESQKVDQKVNFIEWQFGGEPWIFRKFIELSPDGRFVAALEKGNMSWVSVWKVNDSLELDAKVYSTEGREFFVQDIEWVGHYLLILVLDGVKTIDETDIIGYGYYCEHSRILIWDSECGIESDFLKGDFGLMFAHHKRRSVLLFHRRDFNKKEHVGECRVSLYSVPQGKLIKHFKLILNHDPYDPEWSLGFGGYPLFWCPDGERFWMTDEYSESNFEVGTIHVPILRVVDLEGKSKIISGEPRKKWLIVKKAPFFVQECRKGYDDVKGTSYLAMYRPPAVLVDGKLCGVGAAGWYKLRSICFFNEEGLVKEIPLERKRFESLRRSLERIGIKYCEIKALSPDGHRLLLQELKEKEKGVVEDAFEIPFGEKRWVLVWDMETQILRHVLLIGSIDEVYGWVDSSRLIVRARGSQTKTQEGVLIYEWQYGLLCLPDTSLPTKKQ